MSTFWKASMRDKVKNGTVLGLLFGILIASSDISWIQSIVTSTVDIIPTEYHFEYISYVTFALLGMISGYIIDKY